MRKLEIGPAKKHVKGYETIGMEYADVIWDVTAILPYEDETFDKILASHVIEHVEWYRTQSVLKEWTRILKSGGEMEIWIPDTNAVIDVILRAERGERISETLLDTHVKMLKQRNPEKDPYIWANYRLMSAENPKAAIQYHKPHRSIFTFGHLKNQMEKAGLKDVHKLDKQPPYDHGWANMGVAGTK